MTDDPLLEIVDFYVDVWVRCSRVNINLHLHFLHHRSVSMAIVFLFCRRHNWTNLDGHLSQEGLWERREEPPVPIQDLSRG